MDNIKIYRVIDANLNRLREGIRVCEEYFRFIVEDNGLAKKLKLIRQKVREIDNSTDLETRLWSRDSVNDPFAEGTIGSEIRRESLSDTVLASFKRSQEAARVLEEYLKLIENNLGSNLSKSVRFALYTLEKEWVISGKKEE